MRCVMKPNKLFMFVALMALSCTSTVLLNEKAKTTEKIGNVNFPISCGAAEQEQFNRAVAILYSFWYAEALKAFTSLVENNPDCAMGYWGIAMSLWHPLWQPPDVETLKKGWAAVEKAKALNVKTERERDYIAAIEAFYMDSEVLDHRTRALAYEKAMEQIYLRYPEDREAAVFYALALNATALPTDKTYENQHKATEILLKVFAEKPEHPGAAHYLIHNNDYPALADRALFAARRYASIAPSVPHALHMPSHIFTRLGLWQESIHTNRASATAAKRNSSWFEQLHAMDYLVYAYLQGAQDREAKRVLDEANIIGKVASDNRASAYALAAIPARYAIERRQWDAAVALEPRQSRYIYTEAITYFARAMGSARNGDLTTAREDIEKLESLRDALLNVEQSYWAVQIEVQHQAASAWLAYAEGKNDEALQLMISAAELEGSTEKHPVTPGAIVPAHELLGELLLELGKPEQALSEFETSLLSSPNRFNTFYGAARAAELLSDKEKTRDFYEKLVALCENADSERPELLEARAFLAMIGQ